MCKTIIFSILLITALIFAGCSTGNDAISPGESAKAVSAISTHQLWGLWQLNADPSAGTLDAVALRTSALHINVLPFLEPPVLVYLSLDTLQFNGNIIEADIGLRHPFLGLTEFTGFDVCGILISNGTVTGFDNPDLRMAGEGDTRLLNPDGFTRWWNPAEFPKNGTAFGYVDGLLGTPDSVADFNCTLNGYKYYCDDLEADDPLDLITLDGRGVFTPGQKNVRHFTIELGDEGLVFNYAVDANWEYPQGDPPWTAPDDFTENANRPEPYRIAVTETKNTLYNDGDTSGGDLGLSIDVYDWFNAGMNNFVVESPGNFDIQSSNIPTGGGDGFSTYEIDIADATPAEGSIELLISIESDASGYGGLLPGETVCAYFTQTVAVSDESPGDCNPPTSPVLVDPVNLGIKAAVTVDANNVIHMAYTDDGTNLYWSYSEDCGQTWTNLGSVATPGPSAAIVTSTIDMDCGIDEPYVYCAWVEQTYGVASPIRFKIARMDINSLGSVLEIQTPWDHASDPSNYSISGAQICVLADDDMMIAVKYRYPHQLEYFLAHDWSDFASAPENVINGTHINGGSLTYPYQWYTPGIAGDSLGNCYLSNSGYYNEPGTSYANYGSYILKYDESLDRWDWEYTYHHGGSNMYWDNFTNGLYIDEYDHLYWVSEYQIGGTGAYGNDSGTYTMTFLDGPAGGTYNALFDPIPDMVSTVPSAYANANLDYEYRYTSAVADSNGLCYIVYQKSNNDRTVYYITYDGTTWNHTSSPVQVNTTMEGSFPHAVRGYEDWVYIGFTDYDGSPGNVYFVGIKE